MSVKVFYENKVTCYSGTILEMNTTKGDIGSKFYPSGTKEVYRYNGITWDNITNNIDSFIVNPDGSINVNNILIIGTTTDDGDVDTLIDSTKDFGTNSLLLKVIKININNIDYYRIIDSSVVDTISLNEPIKSDINASTIIGSGEEAEGQFIISCIGELKGEIGNEYSIQVVQGVETTGDNIVTFDNETKILTITVNLTSGGDPRIIGAGTVQTLINDDPSFSDKFIVANDFIAGNIPMMVEPQSFIGGEDGIIIPSGCSYSVFNNL